MGLGCACLLGVRQEQGNARQDAADAPGTKAFALNAIALMQVIDGLRAESSGRELAERR